MIRPRSVFLVAAFVATLFACGGTPGTRAEPPPALGPYVVARGGVGVAPVRLQPTPVQDVRGGALLPHESRRMCDLRGGKGSC